MAKVDFTQLPYEEAVTIAMQEFEMDRADAEEFINLVQGKMAEGEKYDD